MFSCPRLFDAVSPVLLAAALSIFASLANAELYTWKDESGKVQYSDKPPPAKIPSRKLDPAPLNTYTPPPPKPATKPETPAPDKQKDAAAGGKTDKGQGTTDKASLCEKAKTDLQAFESKPRQTVAIGGGKFRTIDSTEREAEEAALKKAVAENCR